jgi:hypothetical protein
MIEFFVSPLYTHYTQKTTGTQDSWQISQTSLPTGTGKEKTGGYDGFLRILYGRRI